ncbi:hypothetical protein ARHIZOSPH14_14230 [Agromyces rhizosphaerae]|uniref:uroporphyrinogen-III C-methyltransferase n=1 Tax=Agromyces rhizosphaerae TaxID=88374 RepID=A0A9W6FP49_9MICO|nr:uroporphyrinogen-III C-methyltransferase [Agromyces rhizosphaerae]GLI27181.1 hypothetical protein ARHIZOSPH14_14230 [Agromyces rhizosphaerae]
MHVELDLAGLTVLVVGRADRTRRARARYTAAGARVLEVLGEHAAARLEQPLDAAHVDVLAWVDGTPAERETTVALARSMRLPVLTDAPVEPTPRGHVTLVGGGPGDAELITLAGRRALAEADVVLHDRLGPTDRIDEWAPGAELIDVGKTPGHHAVPQREIERLLVARALEGLRVVRLKGGDPFVFGRGGEEVHACRVAGVPVTVVPGVTSAVSVPGAAGIPVTHREVSRAFTVASGHVPFSEEELAHLVGLGGTLVVLMGVGTLPHLVAGLRRHGMAAEMPIAIVERGFSAGQRTTVSDLGGILHRVAEVRPASPAVIVVGEVVRVPETFGCEDGRPETSDAVASVIARLGT